MCKWLFHKTALSPYRIRNRLIALPQSMIVIVHFFDAFCNPRYRSFFMASSFGNEALVFSTLRSEIFNDSMVLVVYITFLISCGYVKK